MVYDFIDVLSEDLPGLPPNPELELTIELVPKSHAISKASYTMAPTKLTKLIKQL